MSFEIYDNPIRIEYIAAEGQTDFNIPFEFFDDSDINVWKTPLNEEYDETGDMLSLSSDYTVTGAGVTGGGTLTLLTGATVGDVVRIYRDIPLERTIEYQNTGVLDSDTLNNDIDRTVAMVQQVNERLDRAVVVDPVTDKIESDVRLGATPAYSDSLIPRSYVDSQIFAVLPDGDIVASSIAALLSATLSDNDMIITKGRDGLGDGDSGFFYYDSGFDCSSNAALMGVTAFDLSAADLTIATQQASTATGALVRILNGPVSVKMAGAKGDGTTDDTAALQAAINCAAILGRKLYVPAGTYNHDELYLYYDVTLNPLYPQNEETARITIFGDGRSDANQRALGNFTRTVLNYQGATGNGITLDIPSGLTQSYVVSVVLEDLSLIGDTTGWLFKGDQFSAGEMKRVYAYNANTSGNGIYCEGSFQLNLEDVMVNGPGGFKRDPSVRSSGIGIQLNGGGGRCRFVNVHAQSFGKAFYFNGSMTTFVGINIEGVASGVGAHIDGTSGVDCTFIGCVWEYNTYTNILADNGANVTEIGSGYHTTVCPEWYGSWTVTAGTICENGGNIYVCTTAGTTAASGGPTGTGTSISDGTAVWDYAGTYTEPVTGCGKINVFWESAGGTAKQLLLAQGIEHLVHNGCVGYDIQNANGGVARVVDCGFTRPGGSGTPTSGVSVASSAGQVFVERPRFSAWSTLTKITNPENAITEHEDYGRSGKLRVVSIAATLNINEADYVRVSGNTTNVTAIDTQGFIQPGRKVTLHFISSGATVENSTALRLAGSTNVTFTGTATLTLIQDNSGNWIEIGRAEF